MLEERIRIRSELLRYYSLECLYHVGFIFTLFVAFKIWLDISSIVYQAFFFSLFNIDLFIALYWSIILSGLIVLLAYFLLRTMWWGYLADQAIKIKDEKITETSFECIHIACLDMVKIEHPKIRNWANIKLKKLFLLWLSAFIILFVVLVVRVLTLRQW